MRIALVVMPFAAADSPSLAAGLLKAALNERGIECDVKYFNVTMSLLLGATDYDRISREFQNAALAGEWIFSQLYYGRKISAWSGFKREVLDHRLWGVQDSDIAVIRRTAAHAPTLLDVAYESTDWSRYDLVGFTSTFEQTMSSMCLARRIRERHPKILLAAGGANFESVMGRALFDHFDFLDFVCDGEADITFPDLCQAIAENRNVIPPGFHARRNGHIVSVPRDTSAVVDLERLPYPDFDEYFRVISLSGRAPESSWVPVEASRGCWWGERHHCTFCGLNGESMRFRRKSWLRVAKEVDAIERRYEPNSIQFTDNILASEYLDDLLPHWASGSSTVPKFFEIKANMRRHQVALMRQAGILVVQPGIESLCDHSLALMKKGVSAAQNVALLRWCRELGISANWNILYGFPGETPDDLHTTLELMRQITHLDAPSSCSLVRLDRFSPNFVQRDAFGLRDVRPMPGYRHVFDMPLDQLESAAYFFEYSHDMVEALIDAARPLRELTTFWQKSSAEASPGTLELFRHISGEMLLLDSRPGHRRLAQRLTIAQSRVLLAFDIPRAMDRVFETDPTLDREIFDHLVNIGAICRAGTRHVTTAVMKDDVRSTFEQTRPRSKAVDENTHERITINA